MVPRRTPGRAAPELTTPKPAPAVAADPAGAGGPPEGEMKSRSLQQNGPGCPGPFCYLSEGQAQWLAS